jgi:hypothetical protein
VTVAVALTWHAGHVAGTRVLAVHGVDGVTERHCGVWVNEFQGNQKKHDILARDEPARERMMVVFIFAKVVEEVDGWKCDMNDGMAQPKNELYR